MVAIGFSDLACFIFSFLGYNLPGIIAAVFPSVSDAPIRLQGKAIDHVFESPGEILSSIKNFYVNETLKQVYKIIGSLDFVGNPTIIFSSFVAGVRDLVVAPTTAFLKSPTNVNQVGIGVAKGTISLFSHSASGIFGFAAKMSAAAGQAAAIASLDPEFRQWHRDRVVTEATNLNRVWKRRGVLSVSEMITRPVGDLVMGVAMGASGFFISPYKGAVKGGTVGFVQGVATGTAGVVAKPLVGLFDAFTHFSATAHDIAKSVNVLERRYQPALKLRLPYFFGPMNILEPFDPVTARSVYLLGVFTAKSKRGRRGNRSREIHVHSEVLHMEPGVETYAIVTTTRVVLIKLKKLNGGVLSPTFAWEVGLSGEAVVSSQVSDHGHNGVALTISKRVDDKNIEPAPKEDKAQPTPRESIGHRIESIGSRIPFSQLSNVSSRSDQSANSEFDNGYESDGDKRIEAAARYDDDEESDAQDAYHDHGATRAEGKILEWYTVLAEFQHRRQLTALHNSICCIVGNLDAIVVDEVRAVRHGSREGVTTFGIFHFEKGLQDSKTLAASNSALVVALDTLPWMNETLFKAVQGVPRDKRRAFVSGVRSNWTLMRDLEASAEQGGPNWLVEARARAMFVSATHLVPERHSMSDLAIESALDDSISRQSHSDAPFGQEDSIGGIDASISERGVSRTAGAEQNPVLVPQVHPPNADNLESNDMESISDRQADLVLEKDDASSDISGSSHFEDAVSYEVELDGCEPRIWPAAVSPDRSSMTGSINVCHDQHVNRTYESHGEPKMKSSLDVKAAASEGVQEGIVATSSSSVSHPDGSRIDRMEQLMEQLVILNATQAQRQHMVPAEIFSETHSVGAELGIAGVIKNELAELRTQVQARAKEDDALRDEITALRKQLAERRSVRHTSETQRHRFADVFRFGKHGHGEGGEGGTEDPPLTETGEAALNHDLTNSELVVNSESHTEEVLNVETQRKSGRRHSGNSATSRSARTRTSA